MGLTGLTRPYGATCSGWRDFLDLPILEDHLDRCADYFYRDPHKRRTEAPSTPELKERVRTAIDEHDYFSRNTWHS